MQKKNVPPEDVSAMLQVAYVIARNRSGGWDLTIDCSSTVSARGRTYADRFAQSLGHY